MTISSAADWSPRDEAVQADQIAAYDRLREQFGVAYSDMLNWSVFGHAEVKRLLLDHERASSVVSQHVAVPNGMDPPEHSVYRRLIEPFFTADRVAAFRPACVEIAAKLFAELQGRAQLDIVAAFALPFAARIQCAFLGWPLSLEEELLHWIAAHHQAALAQDRAALVQLAEQFGALVERMLAERRARGAAAPQDVTTALLELQVDNEPLSSQMLTSIVRNWTVGEIGTIAAALGIVFEWLARHPDLQARLRAEPALRAEAIDEILRLHGPLASNRRVARCPLEVGGRLIPAAGKITLHWTSANRDPRVFEAADEFRFGRDPQLNLLYGAGIHVCPGAGLARMELSVALDELFKAVAELAPVANEAPVPAHYPASGFARLPLQLRWY